MGRQNLHRARALALALALVIAGPAPAREGPPPSDESTPPTDETAPPADQKQMEAIERTVRDALGAVLQRLQDLIETIPQYEAPEILENGDIIIRRIRPKIIEDERNQLYPADAGKDSSDQRHRLPLGSAAG